MKIKKLISGFTLTELMVSVSIVLVIMSVVLYNFGNFNDNVSLSSAAQEATLSIREAQSYALNVYENQTGAGNFDHAYGIYFSAVSAGGANTSYIIFVDLDDDKKYDTAPGCGSVGTECVKKIDIKGGVYIYRICNENACPPNGSADNRTMHVTFKRPSTNVSINFVNSGGNINLADSLVGSIRLRSPNNDNLYVGINSTGKISITDSRPSS